MRTRLLIAGPLAMVASLFLAASAMAGVQLTVTTTLDNSSGPTNSDGLCTLREAITASNAGTATDDCPSSGTPSENKIGFAPALGANPVINLTAFGDLQFGANDVTVTGPAIVNGFTGFRVITSNGINLTLASLTVSNGSDTTGLGGGIFHAGGGQLVLNNSTVTGNSATKTGVHSANAEGGGIYSQARVTLNGSTVSNNQAVGNCTTCDGSASVLGGGVEVDGDNLTMENSVVSGNQAIASSDGTAQAEADGGGARSDGDILIEHSTISGNLISATSTGAGGVILQGGGLLFHGDTVGLDIELSTIANNLVKAIGPTPIIRGGGISDGTKDTASNYVSDTIAGNGLDPASATTGVAGLNFESQSIGTGSRTFDNTIIANPVGSTDSQCSGSTPYSDGAAPDLEFPISMSEPCFDATHTNVLHLDPQLGALGPNGGPTSTMLPAPTSPVIDQGTAADQNDLTEDQRGLTRPVVFSGLTHPLDGADIGAVEVQLQCAQQTTPTFVCPTPPTPTPAQPAPTPKKKPKCKKKAKKGASSAKKKKCKKKKKK